MKLKYMIVTGILGVFLFNACTKDKGNYQYNDGKKVDISIPAGTYNALLGDTTTVNPVRKYADPTDTLNYTHEWYIDGKFYSDKPTLKYSTTESGLRYVNYYMTDKKSGVTFAPSVFFIFVTSPFQNGWGILYEKDGQSELGHVRVANNQYYDYKDLYKTFNKGEQLGSAPLKLRDYIVRGGRGMYILQRGGQGPVELDANTLQKKLVASQVFLGGVPSDFAPVDMAFFPTADLLVNQNGDLYARFFNGALAFTVPWMSTPITTKGGLKIADVWDSWSRTSTFALMYDKLNKRVMKTRVNAFSTGGGITIDTLVRPSVPYPANYTPLNNLGTWEYVWGGTFNDVNTSMDGAMLIRNPADQNLYYQTFNYMITSTEERLTPKERILFPGNIYVSPTSKYVAIKGRDYLFFTGGAGNNQLYYFDITSRTVVKLYTSYSSRITALTSSDDSQQVAVGLEDGTFILYDISNATLIGGSSKELHRFSGLGKIADIIVKGGNMN